MRSHDRRVESVVETGPTLRFRDRSDAGQQLAARLTGLRMLDPVVVGIAPDGMPVAAEIARALGVPLDTVAVEPLLLGEAGELRLGTTAEGGTAFLDWSQAPLIDADPGAVDEALIATQKRLDERTHSWHRQVKPRRLHGRNVLLVGDLLADEKTAVAAACAVRDRGAAAVTYVAPLVKLEAAMVLTDWVDEILCLETGASGLTEAACFEHCEPVSDDQVRLLLRELQSPRHSASRASAS